MNVLGDCNTVYYIRQFADKKRCLDRVSDISGPVYLEHVEALLSRIDILRDLLKCEETRGSGYDAGYDDGHGDGYHEARSDMSAAVAILEDSIDRIKWL